MADPDIQPTHHIHSDNEPLPAIDQSADNINRPADQDAQRDTHSHIPRRDDAHRHSHRHGDDHPTEAHRGERRDERRGPSDDVSPPYSEAGYWREDYRQSRTGKVLCEFSNVVADHAYFTSLREKLHTTPNWKPKVPYALMWARFRSIVPPIDSLEPCMPCNNSPERYCDYDFQTTFSLTKVNLVKVNQSRNMPDRTGPDRATFRISQKSPQSIDGDERVGGKAYRLCLLILLISALQIARVIWPSIHYCI